MRCVVVACRYVKCLGIVYGGVGMWRAWVCGECAEGRDIPRVLIK